MEKIAFVPAQIRAARALLGRSQEELAEAAKISLTSLREIEGHKRPPDTEAASKIRRALDNLGIAFVPSGPEGGPGVRLINNRPHIIRPPTTMLFWEGIPFTVEWEGREVMVFVSRDVIDDLGQHTGTPPESVYLQTFDQYQGEILDGVAQAITDPSNFDDRQRLRIQHKDIKRFSR